MNWICELGGQNAAARITEIPQSTIFRLVSGGEPSLTTLKLIAEKTGRPLHWWATGEEEEDRSSLVRIPLRPVVASAGAGGENSDEHPAGHLLFSQTFVEAWRRPVGRVEAICAMGDSMEPTIQNGAVVLIDISDTDTNGLHN